MRYQPHLIRSMTQRLNYKESPRLSRQNELKRASEHSILKDGIRKLFYFI